MEEKSLLPQSQDLPEATANSGPQGQKMAFEEEDDKREQAEKEVIVLNWDDYDDAKWEAWLDTFSEDPIIPEAKEEESIEEWEKRMWARRAEQNDDLSEEDDEARRASRFRAEWESFWSPRYGAFEDNSKFRFNHIHQFISFLRYSYMHALADRSEEVLCNG